MYNSGNGERSNCTLLAIASNAYANAVTSKDLHFINFWSNRIDNISDKHFPSGSGFNSGVTFDLDKSSSNKLVFNTSYTHFDQYGYNDGTTDHTITVTPDFAYNMHIAVTGKNKNGIKEYISQVFHVFLTNLDDFSDE